MTMLGNGQLDPEAPPFGDKDPKRESRSLATSYERGLCEKISDEEWRFCKSMDRAAQLINDHRKGLVPIEVTHVETLKTRMIGIAYKTGPHDKGVMLNQCPWCGASLKWWEASEIR